MGRWRPAEPGSTPIISATGHAQLKQELDQLWRHERPQVTAVVTAAAKNGDRSENGDYIYGKRRLAEIDRRVRYLRKRLEGIRIVDSAPSDRSRIYFGARVTLLNNQGDQLRVHILGPDEIDTSKYQISIDSPLARAMLGKGRDEEIRLTTPGGEKLWCIEEIHYDFG